MEYKKIKSFTDLEVWRKAHKLVICIYMETKIFPKEELFGLSSQLRRAVVSITSNIAEGFRKESYKEKVEFYRRSLGSLTEVQNQLLIARDVDLLLKDVFTDLSNQTISISRLLNGLIKKSKEFYS